MQRILLFILFIPLCSPVLSENIKYPDLKPILDAQIGQSVINIPYGIYEMSTTTDSHYTFFGINNVIVNGNGSTIILRNPAMAFNILLCDNLTLKDIILDYDPLPYTQGTITHISQDRKNWTVRIHDGYATENLSRAKLSLFDSDTKQLKKNFFTLYESSYDLAQSTDDPAVYYFTISRSIPANTISVGDYVVNLLTTSNGLYPHTMNIMFCNNFVAENITVYGSYMFSILESDCNNSIYSNCIITRNLDDTTKSISRLMAGNYDGIHSSHASKGPTIVNCRVEYNGDDCIAVNGNFYPIYKVDEGNKCFYILSKNKVFHLSGFVRIFPDDNIVIVDNDGTIKGEGIAQSVELQTPTAGEISGCFLKFPTLIRPEQYIYGNKIVLTDWPEKGINVGDYVYSENRTGSAFQITNNIVGHTRARGVLVKSSNGVIKDNLIEGNQLAGIAVAPEVNWMEASNSNNVEIRNNYIKDCMFHANSAGMTQPGALTLISLNAQNSISPAGSHNNISILDNVIENCPNPAIVTTSVKDLNIYNNTVINNSGVLRTHGSAFGVQNNVEWWFSNVENVTDGSTNHAKTIIPDPTVVLQDNTILISNLNNRGKWLFYLSDLNGRVLKKKQILFDNDRVELDFLLKGLYIITISNEVQRYSYKFVL